jgi:YggT family protein
LVQYFLLWLILGAGAAWAWLPWLALFGLVRVAISGLIGLLIVHAVMSWMSTRSPIADVVARLCAPVLRPFQRIIPLVGGVDLSPLAVLVLLQVAMIILGHLQAGVLQG